MCTSHVYPSDWRSRRGKCNEMVYSTAGEETASSE